MSEKVFSPEPVFMPEKSVGENLARVAITVGIELSRAEEDRWHSVVLGLEVLSEKGIKDPRELLEALDIREVNSFTVGYANEFLKNDLMAKESNVPAKIYRHSIYRAFNMVSLLHDSSDAPGKYRNSDDWKAVYGLAEWLVNEELGFEGSKIEV